MKKIILSFAVVVLGTVAVQAQSSFGIKAGMNIANLRGDDAGDTKSLIGANGGVFANIPVSPNFAVQPEVLYSLEGAKSSSNNDFKLNLNYINIPVMFQYRDASGFYAELGPQLGILTEAKTKLGNTETDVKSLYKSTNISGAAGLGFNFVPSIGVGIRYSLGLTGITESDSDVKTGNFAIGLHYTFGK